MASKELQAVIEECRAQPLPDEGISIQEFREFFEANYVEFPLPPGVRRNPVDADGIPAEWVIAPEAVEERVIYYLHGGGYVGGSIRTYRELAWRLSRAAKARCLLIEYRLAPENPFPAALEDALKAYRWLLSQGVGSSRMVIGGESAGGGLTAATLVALRDAGELLPAAAFCISPWADLECRGKSVETKADSDPILRREFLRRHAKEYLGNTDPRTPLASPIHADLSGLPPLLIQVGTAELLFDDATRLAAKAKSDGVEVTLELWEDMIHAWISLAAKLPEGRQAIDRIGEFVRGHT